VDRGNPRVRRRWRLRVVLTVGSQQGTPEWLGRMAAPPQSWWRDDSRGPESKLPSVLDHGESPGWLGRAVALPLSSGSCGAENP
jgi:hypothetical protein